MDDASTPDPHREDAADTPPSGELDSPKATGITPAQADARTPLITAPMAVDRPPGAGGTQALGVALNDTLRKAGVRGGLGLLRASNRPGQLQCPGCAWPVAEDEHGIATCESGARLIADQVLPRRAAAPLFASYTLVELSQRSDHWLSGQGRLTEPLIHRAGGDGYEPITWDAAIELVAAQLRELDASGRPERAVFYGSGRSSNEAAFVLQLLARRLGTNNLPSSSNLCHDPSAQVLAAALGRDLVTGTATVADLERAGAIFCFGHNPGTSHARMLQSLRRAKLRGAKLVAVNPMRESGLRRYKNLRERQDWFNAGVELSDLHLQVRIGGDRAVIAALMKATLEADALDRAFLDAHCEGPEALAQLTATLEGLSWAQLAEASGVAEDQLRDAGRIYAEADGAVFTWGTGLTQHVDAGATLTALVSLLALRGNLGRAGAGPLPLPGHSNAIGSKRAGLDHAPDPAFLERLGQRLDFDPPAQPGLDFVGAMEAMHRGEVDLFVNLGGNPLSAAPDTDRSAEALRRCRLAVHLSTKLNRGHLVTGETTLILPCLSRAEIDAFPGKAPGEGPAQAVTADDLDGHRRPSRGVASPVAESLRSEVAILSAIADASFPASPLPWPALAEDYETIRAHLDAVSPAPTQAGPQLPAKALRLELAPPVPPAPLGDDELWMTSIRSHDQHNSTIFDKGDRLRGIRGYRRLVFMGLADLERLGLEPYEQIDLSSEYAGRTRNTPRWVIVPYDLPPGCCATYWPEANVLVPLEARDPQTGVPSSKAVRIRVARSEALPERKPLQRLRR